MPPTNFHLKSIAKLISQRGERLQFCNLQVTGAEDLDNGIVAQKKLVCKSVRGYAIPETVAEFGLGGTNKTYTGNFSCWIVTRDITRDQFTGDARIIRESGKIYQIEYKDFVLDRDRGQLHSLKLVPTAESPVINLNQPDEIFNDLI